MKKIPFLLLMILPLIFPGCITDEKGPEDVVGTVWENLSSTENNVEVFQSINFLTESRFEYTTGNLIEGEKVNVTTDYGTYTYSSPDLMISFSEYSVPGKINDDILTLTFSHLSLKFEKK